MRYEAVLFDLDGVLTSTAALHLACWKRVFDPILARAGQPPFDAVTDFARHVDGRPRAEGARAVLTARGLPAGSAEIARIARRKGALAEEALAAGDVRVFPGSVRWVLRLRRQGLATAVVSSSVSCPAVLASAGIAGLFDEVVDGGTIARLGLRGKPAPDGFLRAADRLGVQPERAVVVEDALAGVRAGRDGGFGLVIGVARTAEPAALRAAGADLVVTDLGEMLR